MIAAKVKNYIIVN